MSGRDWERMRRSILGLGEDSGRKSFYPELQERLGQLEEAREGLRLSQENLWSVFNSLHDAVLIHDRRGCILEANRAAGVMFGVKQEDLKRLTIQEICLVDPGRGDPFHQLQEAWVRMDRQGFLLMEWDVKRPSDGGIIASEVALRPATWYGQTVISAVIRDITGRKQAEGLLRQAQKLDSLGQLAGGVAHDTNNMLSVILGYTDMILENPVLEDEGIRQHLSLIRKAALHSSELTRQLLAFARKQTIQPCRTDLNALVEETQRMLRRLIGENHSLVWRPATTLWNLWIDPTQVSQVLVNLVVNARDALEGSGTITLETHNLHVNEAMALHHPDAVPGDYGVLTVRDTGKGMDEDVLAHIFEPFFTTKKVGEGTGLGLAMVYGIVRQNEGFITVASSPGAGATFHLHFPRFRDSVVEPRETREAPGPAPGGTETVLLVEDEEALLDLARKILETSGYRVLAASGAVEALALLEGEPGPIHLLATDVVMPGMNGMELYRDVIGRRPGIRGLLMSGYAADVLTSQGFSQTGMLLLKKPYNRRELLEGVRRALDDAIGEGQGGEPMTIR